MTKIVALYSSYMRKQTEHLHSLYIPGYIFERCFILFSLKTSSALYDFCMFAVHVGNSAII